MGATAAPAVTATTVASGTTAGGMVSGIRAGSGAARTSPELRVVLVDGRHERREVMRYLTEHCGPGIVVVGSADDADEALAVIAAQSAGVAIVEIQLPLAVGLDVVSTLRRQYPDLGIVVCSFHATATTRTEAMERGADVYLVKPVSARELSRALSAPRLSTGRSVPAGRPETAAGDPRSGAEGDNVPWEQIKADLGWT